MNNYKEKYLKYKLKYLNLKKNNFIGGGDDVLCTNVTEVKLSDEYLEANTKIIDGFHFTLMYKCKFKDYYDTNSDTTIEDPNFKVYIKSNKDGVDKYFCVYPSSSDLGFWRLAYWSLGSYQKGPDYVQSSFISLELQYFINERLSVLEVNYDIIYNGILVNDDIHTVITDKNRQIQLKNQDGSMIELLNRTNSCGNKVQLKDIEEISTLLENIYKIEGDPKDGHKIERNMVVNHNNWNIKGNIYSIKLKSAQDVSENIILYYFDAKISIKNNEEGRIVDPLAPFVVSYPILAIKKETKINEYGVYNGYINLNSYICKMFEYGYQVDFNQEYSPIHVDGEYVYIGNFYNGLFPIKNIFTMLNIDEIPKQDTVKDSGCTVKDSGCTVM